jgi:hypothetical protein
MVKADSVAEAAVRLLDGPEIPYVAGCTTLKGMDCQGLVKYCASTLGGKLSYAGSNAMYRACHKAGTVWTLDEARKQGKLVPGALAFKVDRDGGEGAQYKADGLGNASHVGVVVLKSRDIWSVDASETAKKVRSRTSSEADYGWKYVGWLPDFDYGAHGGGGDSDIGASGAQPQSGITLTNLADLTDMQTSDVNQQGSAQTWRNMVAKSPDGGRINLRRNPTTLVDNRIGAITSGTVVAVLSYGAEWSRVRFMGVEGCVMSRYLFEMTEMAKG